MTKYELTKTDIEEFSTMIIISKSVEEHYNELAQLEINGKKRTPEYNSCIERLKSSLSLENTLFERLTTSIEKVIALIEYMKKKFGGGYSLETPFYEIIANQNYSSLKKIRIHKRLNDYLNFNFANYINEQFEAELEILKEADPEFIEKINRKLKVRFNVNETLINEQLMFILSKLQEEIENPFAKSDRKELIKAKYRFAYIVSFVEKTLIESNFEISRDIYFGLDLISATSGMSPKELGDLKEKLAIKEIGVITSSIISHKDIEYNRQSLLIELKIKKIVIRGLLQILTDEQIMFSNDAFHMIIEGHDLENGCYDIGIKAIREAYKKYKIDKKSIITLSLIRNRK